MSLRSLLQGFFFDRRDHALLAIVNDVLARPQTRSMRRLLAPYLHPHGIKEMAATPGLRMAFAVIQLLRCLDRGQAHDRLVFLRSMRDEALYSGPARLRLNTARVLLQIMKDLVRETDEARQLELANDFRRAATGRPRVVAAQLARYHLAEMPEKWNQLAFDDHVHDANTKGRKSATHLILDAWIKGIRRLTVIYYNHVPPEVAEELLEAAAIMGVRVRVGIEYSSCFRGKYVRFIWTPHGFTDSSEFMEFLAQPETRTLMSDGREVSAYQRRYVLAALKQFNSRHRPELNRELGIRLEPISEKEFLEMVGSGQASLHHLGKCVHDRLMPLMTKRLEHIRGDLDQGRMESGPARELVNRMNSLDIEAVIDEFLRPKRNPGLVNPQVPPADPDQAPELMSIGPCDMLRRLEALHSSSRITLNLSNLTVEDVLELVHDCGAMITHLEIFNFKDRAYGRSWDCERIVELQAALNSGNAVRLKRFVSTVLDNLEGRGLSELADRRERLTEILFDISALAKRYARTPLKSRIGTDSTGGSCMVPGMGLVIQDTLPKRARKQLDKDLTDRLRIPVSIRARLRRIYEPRQGGGPVSRSLLGLAKHLPGISRLAYRCREDWVVRDYVADDPGKSNLRTLGGLADYCGNGLRLEPEGRQKKKTSLPSMKYFNCSLKNAAKIILGFVPAFVSFYLTKDWWLLAWFGAFIWFGITGVRNIIQSVLGAGGIRRSPLLNWQSFINWDRLADSLLYTGFSVPLLDWLVKDMLLAQGLGVTVHSDSVALYSIMALVNGCYITGHNLLRGLPRAAAAGNFFRSVLSIPLALAFNAVLGAVLGPAGAVVLQKWAAVISKLASDCVAGIIEGLADRWQNIHMRDWDYKGKLEQVYDTYARLELMFPREDLLEILASPMRYIRDGGRELADLEKILFVNALDLMYIWMYQPRARTALTRVMRDMTQDERKAFLLSQYVLTREREISQMFIDGLVGKNFARALAFYLDRYRQYLEELHHIAGRYLPTS